MRPDIAVLLNLTPDHLDRHGSFEAYGRAKARMFENQTERDAAVLNADDAAGHAIRSRAAAVSIGSAARSASPAALSCTTIRSFSGCDGEDVALLER